MKNEIEDLKFELGNLKLDHARAIMVLQSVLEGLEEMPGTSQCRFRIDEAKRFEEENRICKECRGNEPKSKWIKAVGPGYFCCPSCQYGFTVAT